MTAEGFETEEVMCHVSVNGTELLLCLVMDFMLGDSARNCKDAPEYEHG